MPFSYDLHNNENFILTTAELKKSTIKKIFCVRGVCHFVCVGGGGAGDYVVCAGSCKYI